MDTYTSLLRHMAGMLDDPLHQDTLLGVAWHSLVAFGAGVGIILQLALTAAAVLLAGAAAHGLCRGLRQLSRHSAYGYHQAKLDQARQAGDTAAVDRHALRAQLLADQLDKNEGDQ